MDGLNAVVQAHQCVVLNRISSTLIQKATAEQAFKSISDRGFAISQPRRFDG